MQETHWIDEQTGKLNIERLFFTGPPDQIKSQLIEAYNQAMSSIPGIVLIKQEILERTSPCPCGSKKHFEKCCLWKVVSTPPVPIAPFEEEND